MAREGSTKKQNHCVSEPWRSVRRYWSPVLSFLPALPEGFPSTSLHLGDPGPTYSLWLLILPPPFPVFPGICSLGEVCQEVEAGVSPLYLPGPCLLSDIGMFWRDYSVY